MTAGAAQTMLKAQGLLPDGRTVMAGTGPLLWLLAAQILRAGGKIAAILDTTPRRNLLRAAPHLPDFMLSPYFAKGLALLREVKAKVPVRRVDERRGRRRRQAQRGRRPTAARMPADLLLLHQGVVPNVNLALAAGAAHEWNERQLCFQPSPPTAARGSRRCARTIIPAFEKKHGVKVEYVAGNSTDTLAKLQAQKANQVIDVAIVDDGPMYQAIQLGFCGKIEGLDKAELYRGRQVQGRQGGRRRPDRHRLHGQHQGLQGEGLGDADLVERSQGPEVQEAAGDPADQQHLRPPHAVMFARMNGGGEKNIEPGFKVMKDEINPNVLVYEPSPGKMTELFQSGQAVIAVWGTGRVQAFANTGFPVDFIYPKEGAPILLASACPVAKANVNPLAHEFIKTMISRRVQTALPRRWATARSTRRSTSTCRSCAWRPSASAPS